MCNLGIHIYFLRRTRITYCVSKIDRGSIGRAFQVQKAVERETWDVRHSLGSISGRTFAFAVAIFRLLIKHAVGTLIAKRFVTRHKCMYIYGEFNNSLAIGRLSSRENTSLHCHQFINRRSAAAYSLCTSNTLLKIINKCRARIFDLPKRRFLRRTIP